VMHPMNQMKLSPLPASQGSERRMVDQSHPAPESALALRDDRIHRCNLRPHVTPHLFGWQSSRLSHPRRFSPCREEAEADNQQRTPALLHRRSCCRGRARFQQPLESLDRACIAEVQMLQHLRRAPLARRMPTHLLTGHAFHRKLQGGVQLFQAGIHGTTLAFLRLQVECCATPIQN
jgi:hypothetical protein